MEQRKILKNLGLCSFAGSFPPYVPELNPLKRIDEINS
jgi:hypothetical protein